MLTMHMPSKQSSIPTYAPGQADTSGDVRPRPRVDDPLVQPETREEKIRGRQLYALPAHAPHGDAHFHLDVETGVHLKPGYVGATDLLTRLDDDSEIAPDVSVRREGVDPGTGGRYLEDLVFEVVHTQPEREVSERAALLVERGVRRVFAFFVTRRQVAEWSPSEGRWVPLPDDSTIDDPCFLQPLPVRALLDRTEGRKAMARVLVEERNPVIEELRRTERQAGLLRAVDEMCIAFRIPLWPARRAALARMTDADLAALIRTLASERRWPS